MIVVAVFVLIGRATHEEGFAWSGTLQALWPFVVALLAGWLAARALRLPLTTPRAGGVVWPVTLVLGMGLRALSGQGTALPFMIVATLVLGAGLLGWRLIGTLLGRGAIPSDPES
nr:DUF3054 domain-containing protein [Ornithinimicrobium sp. F0845]